MTRKSRAMAAIATVSALALFPTASQAGNDPRLGALVGGVFGAAIGHGISGHDGAIVGGVLGALTGASIAAGSGYYGAPYRYETPHAYYPSAPVYYSPPRVVYRAAPVVVYRAAPRRPVYTSVVVARPHGWRAGQHDHRDGYGRR